MNFPQKITSLLFSLFLLMVGIRLLGDEQGLSAVIAIALSGVGLYFFFSVPFYRKISIFRTKTFKVLMATLAFVVSMVGICLVIYWIWVTLR